MTLEAAKAALETGTLCDACLGRCFSERGTDLTNEARGESLRKSVAMKLNEPVEPVDPSDCWVCEGVTSDVTLWANRVLEAIEDLTVETFQVGTRVPDSIEERESELREAAGLEPDAGETMNAEYNRAVGKLLEDRLDAVVDFEYPDVVTILDLETGDVELQLNPTYLGGRYRKLEPGLDQRMRICRVCNGKGTEWREGEAMACEACDGSGYDTRESMEWYITQPIKIAMDGTEAIFNTAGQEDDDVLVLGEGRPFVVEVKEARTRPLDTKEIQEEINTASDQIITVDGLAKASRDLVEYLTQTPVHETYQLELSFADAVSSEDFTEAIDALDAASVRQTLERGDQVTEQVRKLGWVSGKHIGQTTATVELGATKGIDFEALMVGDTDRSNPNLADLVGTDVTVESIAVVSIEGEVATLDMSEYLSS